MLLDDTGRGSWEVVASDVSFQALAGAEKAIYTESEIQGLSSERRRRYLSPARGGYEVVPSIRRMVRIAHHNLALDEPQTIVPDAVVVFCRNVLMYFGREESAAGIQRIASHIAPGGHLFLGHSDSPARLPTYFAAVRVAASLRHR